MNVKRPAETMSRALAALAGGALVAGLTVTPVPPASATTTEPSPAPSVTLNEQACGDEPNWYHGNGDYVPTRWGATFDAPTDVRGVDFTILAPDGSFQRRAQAPVRDGVAKIDDHARLEHGRVYTVDVRLNRGGVWTEPVLSCRFGVLQPPVVTALVPVLGAGAVYVSGDARGGVGVAGEFVAATRQGPAAAYEYALTGTTVRPATWENLPVAEGAVARIPVVPVVAGRQYLHVRGIDEHGVRGPATWQSILVSSPTSTRPAPPAVTLAELDGPADGRIPLSLTLTEDLVRWPTGEVLLRHGTREIGRRVFDEQTETMVVEQSGLGTGYQNVTAEYRQFTGAPVVTRTTGICAADCAFTGGKATLGTYGEDVRLDPDLYVKPSGFSPTPTSYTYEWLRDGKVIASGARYEDSTYLSLPPDEGRTLTARVTAHRPRTAPKTVSVSVKVGDREDPSVCVGGKLVGTVWSDYDTYCHGTGDTYGLAGSGRALEMLVVEPRPAHYAYVTSTNPGDHSIGSWLDMEGFVQGRGWEGLKRKGDVHYIGSVGQRLRLEALRIDHGGQLAPYYDVWYRAYVPKYGWLGWAKNGETSGTTGMGQRIEAVQVRMLPKGTRVSASGTGNAPSYDRGTQAQVSVQPYLRPSGWKPAVPGGSTAGSVTTSQRLNAVRVGVDGKYSGGVQVSARVEGDGWRPYAGNGGVAGTAHDTRRTSGYKMRLTGEMANQYDVYYRVYVAGTGWLGWARNGAAAGTTWYGHRNTAVQVVLVKKGERALMSASGRAAYKY